jgi:hypothetical protein
MGSDNLGGAHLLERQLRVLMNVASPREHFGFDSRSVARNLVSDRLAVCTLCWTERSNEQPKGHKY